SRSVVACARTSRARVSRCSEPSGLRLWGMVMLPTAPGVEGSRSSPISGRWSAYTSPPIRARVALIIASRWPNSAIRSRAVSQGGVGGASGVGDGEVEVEPLDRCGGGDRLRGGGGDDPELRLRGGEGGEDVEPGLQPRLLVEDRAQLVGAPEVGVEPRVAQA